MLKRRKAKINPKQMPFPKRRNLLCLFVVTSSKGKISVFECVFANKN